MKMEQRECSETLETIIHTPKNIPKENIRFSKHDETLVFTSPKHADGLWGPPSPIFKTYGGTVPGVKQPKLEVNLLFPSCVEVKNELGYTSTPPIRTGKILLLPL
jgi:hypothetical protein